MLADFARTTRHRFYLSCSTTPANARSLIYMVSKLKKLERALSRHVNLKSGGYLIIDQTELRRPSTSTPVVSVGIVISDDNDFQNEFEAADCDRVNWFA